MTTEKTSFTVQIRFDGDLLKRLDEKCEKEHRNRSETIKMLIKKYLDEKSNDE
jgi:metal-responsive CopG/Arc/MetJ family transcriptional regulator